MTTCSASTEFNLARWHRQGDDWHLSGAGRTYASIDRDGGRWLCYALDDAENDTFLGQSRNLASGKAHLSLHYAPRSPSNACVEEIAPM